MLRCGTKRAFAGRKGTLGKALRLVEQGP